ncbi:AraC family transcriptional regulator [Cohnella abietis]|uniref:HTH araC/xylS-type domain-containing protein n=1 Tax=Cohnella abietis TaxID=2507935 RepID=A0A3T1D878_9BACL|nr:helix-turn-helix domain-containing protein [Cohnella abietis]BBI34290.1 hypothetical protein KCTCHS21_36890 [Cohnella abietis]
MNYYDKIIKTIDFIEIHLKEDLSPNNLAEQAFFSVTHFYRIFRGMVGESVKEYIRKRRLSQSAIELLASEKRIIEIAMEYGFDSQETYIRAFMKMFGITPGRYRRCKDNIVLYEKANIGHRLHQRRADTSSFSVAQSDQVPLGMIKRTIPSSKYAVFTHCNYKDHLKDIYQYIYGVWLPDSGYEVAELDTIECYEFIKGHSTNGLDIYIPIK